MSFRFFVLIVVCWSVFKGRMMRFRLWVVMVGCWSVLVGSGAEELGILVILVFVVREELEIVVIVVVVVVVVVFCYLRMMMGLKGSRGDDGWRFSPWVLSVTNEFHLKLELFAWAVHDIRSIWAFIGCCYCVGGRRQFLCWSHYRRCSS